MLKYTAYLSREKGMDFSFKGRDDHVGILGTFNGAGAAPVVVADTLEELRHRVRAYLGEEPSASLYLTDSEGRVYEILINEKYHKSIARGERRFTIAIALLFFCVTGLLATAFGIEGRLALLGIIGVGALYSLILRVRFFNAIEGALVCEILLVSGLFLLLRFQ